MSIANPIHSIHYDERVDAIEIALVEEPRSVRTVQLDKRRFVDLDGDGRPVAIELLHVSRGVRFDGLPHAEAVYAALRQLAVDEGWPSYVLETAWPGPAPT
jgi:hypothetical protein